MTNYIRQLKAAYHFVDLLETRPKDYFHVVECEDSLTVHLHCSENMYVSLALKHRNEAYQNLLQRFDATNQEHLVIL